MDLASTSFKYGNKPLEVFERVKKEGITDGYSRIDTTVFPGRQVEGTEDLSHDRRDLPEGRGGILGEGSGAQSQTGTAGGTAAGRLDAERAGALPGRERSPAVQG